MNDVAELLIATALSGVAAGFSRSARSALHVARLADDQLEPKSPHTLLFTFTVVAPLLLTLFGYCQLQQAFNSRDWMLLASGAACFGVTYWLCQKALVKTQLTSWLRRVGSRPARNGAQLT